METINAEDIGRRAVVPGMGQMSDLKLAAEIRRLERTCASFGGAMLLAAYRQEQERRERAWRRAKVADRWGGQD